MDFIPLRINHVRDERYDVLYKVIVPKAIIKNRNISLGMGSHNLINVDLEPDKSLDLKIAHFPLRSKEQAMSKILVGWPNMIYNHRKNNSYGVHWKLFFEKIMDTGFISDEDLTLFSKNYSLAKFEDDIEIHEKTMNIDFCKDIEMRYSYRHNYFRNVLENYLRYADEYNDLYEELDSLKNDLDGRNKLINTLYSLNDAFDFNENLINSDSDFDESIMNISFESFAGEEIS